MTIENVKRLAACSFLTCIPAAEQRIQMHLEINETQIAELSVLRNESTHVPNAQIAYRFKHNFRVENDLDPEEYFCVPV